MGMLNEFRKAYPQGSLISELLNIYQGKYVVRVLAIVDDVTLATGLAAEDTLEIAEDRARLRALSAIDLHPTVNSLSSPVSADRRSPDLSARASQSMATRSKSPDLSAMSEGFGGATDLPQDDSGAVVSGGSDRWLTSSQADPQESIASVSDRPTSVDLDNEPIFAPVSGADVSTLTGQTETGSVRTTELKTHPLDEEQEIHHESGESGGTETTSASLSGSNLLDADERKTKIAESTIEIQRLNWTTQQGREFLQERYNCRARSQLSDEQLLDFLHYLRTQPNPT